MKSVSPILFLLVYLVANTELHQFMHLPVFFEHYQEHREGNPDIDLIDFVIIHYFEGDTKNADYARDQQLPFKNAKCPEVSFSIAMLPEDFPEPKVLVFNLSRNVVMFKSLFKASSFHFTIWQPPRG